MAGILYLVPTPIGNLGDISLRAKQTLENADFIAAEDTRVTLKLLNHLEIKKSLVSYYEHNKTFKGSQIVERILAGETCALVSDAGSPAISDPGEDLVKQCAEAGITVCAIPGPCAAITALSISGQSTGRFCFEGFLSMSKKSRREHLDSLRTEKRTMIFYEAPHKLMNTLEDMAQVFGADRPISFCRTDQAPRAGAADHPGRGHPLLQGKSPQGRVRPGGGRGPGGRKGCPLRHRCRRPGTGADGAGPVPEGRHQANRPGAESAEKHGVRRRPGG